ncbi:MAG: ABC transporter ATP-binding protein/permease [Oscillospiraceae bacterium]|nr:ABC transporter ATP-binding protein/permease [Oscillospiraceae bacterium]
MPAAKAQTEQKKKQKFSLKTYFTNVWFLFRPWLKHGRGYLALNFIQTGVLYPIRELMMVMIVQAVIDVVQYNGGFRKALLTALFYAGISIVCTAGSSAIDALHNAWKVHDIKGKIEQEIYRHAIRTDTAHLDNPDFYDSYKLATESFWSKSVRTMNLLFWIVGCFLGTASITTLVSLRAPFFLVMMAALAALGLATETWWARMDAKKTKLQVGPKRRVDYLHRLFYQREVQADLRSTRIAPTLFSMYGKAVKDGIAVGKMHRPGMTMDNFAQSFIDYIPTIAVLIYVAHGFGTGKFTDIGLFATLIAAATKFSSYITGITYEIGQLTLCSEYGGQVRSFFEFKSTLETQEDGLELADGKPEVELRNVHFCYPGGGFCLNDVSLHAAPGEKIAIVGENGAGKSTLMKLLLRLYDTDSGQILYNGTDIKDYAPKALRSKIGVAFQHSNIFALTLRENLQVYAEAEDDKLRDALRAVGLERLTDSLDTELTREFEEDGLMLSGGEAQKLALARLLVGDFGLVLLDEPSSALDPLAEAAMTELLFEKANTATTIMVAHRLSTVRHADRIYVMADGTVTECGTHEELIALGGTYREMFLRQGEKYRQDGSTMRVHFGHADAGGNE